jgi:UDP-hydrolysing UDP-N-acetyl-D-glucosamine 2-epimerase
MKRKILYISGTRADYGLMRSVLAAIDRRPDMDLHIAVTGMHLQPEFGTTAGEIQKDGFACHIVNTAQANDTKEEMASFIGRFIQNLIPVVKEIQPDFILVLGDRGEMLGGAIAGAYMGIPVVHIHGGEVTATVDESARHAITKLAHIHLAATEESAARIIRMGEGPARVFVVGAPGLDQIAEILAAPDTEVLARYAVDPLRPLVMVIQHPVPLEPGDPAGLMNETLKAVEGLDCQIFVVYPNADAGGRSMIAAIEAREPAGHFRAFRSIPHGDFLHLLKRSSVIVGNSSSAIIEAPSFWVPAVNIGTRQKGRQQGENVIDTGYDAREIAAAVKRALEDSAFREKVKSAKNPYGDGNSSGRIVTILADMKITPELLQKRMMY